MSVMSRIVELIRSGERFIVTGHMNPDGDVLGSMMSLACILRRLGKTAVVYNRDPMPDRYHYLPLADELVNEVPQDVRFDAAFILDCADPSRVAVDFRDRLNGSTLIALDHHTGTMEQVDIALHDEQASAVGVLVHRVAKALGVPLDREIAEGIYASIVTDTGSFRYSNTNPEAFTVAAEALEAGVDPWRTASELFESQPLAKLKILGEALMSLRVSHDGLVAWMVLDAASFERAGADLEMLDGAVDIARRAHGTEVAVCLRQSTDPGKVRVSLRSRGRVDVETVAAALGGGGHRFAAGCHLPAASLEEAEQRIRGALVEALQGL